MSDTTKKVDDGGPAYPVRMSEPDGQGGWYDLTISEGMSIRDVFAKDAMKAMLTAAYASKEGAKLLKDAARTCKQGSRAFVARCAYRFADAMLEQRGKEAPA